MALTIVYVHGIGAIGGAERELLAILSSIDRTRVHPVVVCPPDGSLAGRVRMLDIPVNAMRFPAWRKLHHVLRIPAAVFRLMSVLRAVRPHVVHVNDYWWGPLCYLACRMARIHAPVLVHIRQSLEAQRIRQYRLGKFDKLLAVSNGIKSVLEEGGLRSETIEVLYGGIDVETFARHADGRVIRRRYGLQPGQPVVGTVANVFPRKGHECFIDAMDHLRTVFPDIHCFIVGKGDAEYLARLQRRVRSKTLQRHMTFAGFQENVADFLEAFDVFVLPSRLEGFGIALIEAMAAKKPVVASRTGGIPEVVEDGVTGCLVPPGDARQLASAIQTLLNDPETRRRMGEAGKERAQRLFGKQRMMEQLNAVYHACARVS